MDVTEIGKKLGLSESKQVICKAAELHHLCDIQFDCSAIGIERLVRPLFAWKSLLQDPRLTDYDTLLENIHGLKEGKAVQVPIYDFKSSSRTGYRTIQVPGSRIVIIEGMYALSERLRPLLDLHVSVTGGVHFDLVKRVLRDIQRAGQEPKEIIHQMPQFGKEKK